MSRATAVAEMKPKTGQRVASRPTMAERPTRAEFEEATRRNVSGRYVAARPVFRPLPRFSPVEEWGGLVDGFDALKGEAANGTELAQIEEELDALIPVPFPIARETLFLDVDGRYPQMTASGTIYSGIRTRVHWIAKVVRLPLRDSWVGKIWYKDGQTSSAFPYRYVQIKVRNLFVPTQRMAILRFSGPGTPSRTRIFRFKSSSFRPIEFEFDYAEGTDPVLAIGTHDHPNRPPTLPGELLQVGDVFERAGFSVRVSPESGQVPISLAGADPRWTDMEMHDAMQVYWSRFSSSAQWALWTFFGEQHQVHGYSLGGIMFDDIGPNHRQGTSIFYNSFISDPQGDPHPDEWVKRMKFWTACHEMGHAFNLAHAWQKNNHPPQWGTPWLPWLENEPESRSFMNYPFRVEGGESAFFRDFEYRFSDQELLFMRHAPERYVQMGNADWFDHHAFEQADAPARTGFELTLRLNEREPRFEFLEPVRVELKLKNVSGEPQIVPANVLRDSERLTLVIKKQGKPAREFVPYAHYCFDSTHVALTKDESLYESLLISAGRNGFDLADPGMYTLQAVVRLNGHELASQPLTIWVAPPEDRQDEVLAQDFFTEDVGRTLVFGGTNYLTGAIKTLDEISQKLSKRMVAIHAAIVLANSAARDFKALVIPEGAEELRPAAALKAKIKRVKPELETARSHIQAAVESDPDRAADTLGHIGLNSTAQCVAESLAQGGDPDAAASLLDTVHGTLSERKVLPVVLEDIKQLRSYLTRSKRSKK